MSALKLLSSMASREVLRELAAQFDADNGSRVVLEAAGGVEVAKRLRSGEAADIVVLARNAIDALGADGILLPASVTDLAQSGIGVAVPADAPVPDLSSEAAVRRAVEHAPSISYSTGPSGVYLEKKFEAWGQLEQLRSRIMVPPPGTPVASLVASGRVSLGFQQLSELLNVPGIAVAGLLPPGVQLTTVFSGAVTSKSTEDPLARRLLAYMASPQTRETKRRFGMDGA